jgi:hypothetical protein
LGECSGSPSGQYGSDFQWCFSPPQQLVAMGRPRPCNGGQWRLETALGRFLWAARALHGRTSPAWTYEMTPPSPTLQVAISVNPQIVIYARSRRQHTWVLQVRERLKIFIQLALL